jgi:hypothetical protein
MTVRSYASPLLLCKLLMPPLQRPRPNAAHPSFQRECTQPRIVGAARSASAPTDSRLPPCLSVPPPRLTARHASEQSP